MSFAIGFDIGGTHIRLALVSSGKKILARKKVEVGIIRGVDEFVDRLTKLILQIRKNSSLKMPGVVGLGVPGIVSSSKEIVYSSPYYPDWKNFNIVPMLSKKIGLPVVIDNDANMVAFGELTLGAAKDWKDFLLLTLGTGIGGAIVIGKKIYHGDNGFTGEFGHMVLQTEGPDCACGSRGCFESLVSATAINRIIRSTAVDSEAPGSSEVEALLKLDPSKMAQKLAGLAKSGNYVAKDIFEQMGYFLGIGLASLVNVTGIQKIVLGGGLMRSKSLFLQTAMDEMKRRTYAKTMEGVEIRVAKLGDDAGVLGSAFMALEKCGLGACRRTV